MPWSAKGQEKYRRLHEAIWSAIEGRTTKFQNLPVETPAFEPVVDGYSDAKLGKDFPVLRHLDRALEAARGTEFKEIAEAFAAVADQLPWSQNPNYNEENGGRELLNGYAYASLSGPEGPLECMVPRGGFYLMGPDVHYPNHHHGPREIYLVITPGIEWRLDNDDWFAAEPGDLIYHAPWQLHSMRSGDAPALAYAAWLETGNRMDVSWSADSDKN